VDPASVFARIDLLVVPSLWEEPLTRVIAESFAAGVPVAVSRLGGMPEIVDEGQSGYVFEGGSVEAIRQLLEGIPDKPLSAPEQVAWRITKSAAFSVESVYERHRSLWQATASNAG
jgi:glycosyltransferase involved in cell wall biosynthesis